MPWSTTYLPDLDVVMTVYGGTIPVVSLQQAVQATLVLGRQHGTGRFLADCTTLEGGHSIIDLYNLATLLEGAGITRSSREAIVLPQLGAAATEVGFWETTCRNRGFNVRVFDSLASATTWLTDTASRKSTS